MALQNKRSDLFRLRAAARRIPLMAACTDFNRFRSAFGGPTANTIRSRATSLKIAHYNELSLMPSAVKFRAALLSSWSILTLVGCEKPGNETSAQPTVSPTGTPTVTISQQEWGQPFFDVCSLIPKEEIERTQETRIDDVRGMGRADGDSLVSQCIYTAETASQSAVVAVTQNAPQAPGKRTPRDRWDEAVSRAAKRRGEGKEKFIPPKKIEGLGDDAYWMGGAVYVLTGETMLRLSVGGPDPEETKMQKSKALAQQVLSQLPR